MGRGPRFAQHGAAHRSQRDAHQYVFLVVLPADAGASIPPFFICLWDVPPDLSIVLAPDAPGTAPVSPPAFGVPIPAPPWPAVPPPAAPPPAPPACAQAIPEKLNANTKTEISFAANGMMLSLCATGCSRGRGSLAS